jgi:hypothetical protein
MSFEQLNLTGWRQFDFINLQFHPRLTILTGANGSGKTALLRILARHFQWSFEELTTPRRDKAALLYEIAEATLEDILTRNGNTYQLRENGDLPWSFPSSLTPQAEQYYRDNFHTVGQVQYTERPDPARIMVPNTATSPTYDFHIPEQLHSISGAFIPSHRSEFRYRQVDQIPIGGFDINAIREKTLSSQRNRSMYIQMQIEPPSYYLKESLISWAIFGLGNSVVRPDSAKVRYFESFQSILRNILPTNLGFIQIKIDPPEVILETQSGSFMVDASSGGISAIIDLAWQIFILDPDRSKDQVVVIDEVENHLHASMQRSILPGLCHSFPRVQFIVSTHSPLIVGSVRDSHVYALRYNDSRRIFSEKLDLDSMTGGAAQVLREVLGVPFTAPVWVEETLANLASEYFDHAPSQASLQGLRTRLDDLGLSEFSPAIIADVLDHWDKQS